MAEFRELLLQKRPPYGLADACNDRRVADGRHQNGECSSSGLIWRDSDRQVATRLNAKSGLSRDCECIPTMPFGRNFSIENGPHAGRSSRSGWSELELIYYRLLDLMHCLSSRLGTLQQLNQMKVILTSAC